MRPLAPALLLSLVAALSTAAGCSRGQAEELLEQVRDDDYRSNYARAPGWPDPQQPGFGPHGGFVDIYVNEVVSEAIEAGEPLGAWPEGSIIVKDGWEDADAEALRYVAIMEKRGGGEWFWAEYEEDDSVAYAGLDLSTCTGCHSSGEDQVRAFGLP